MFTTLFSSRKLIVLAAVFVVAAGFPASAVKAQVEPLETPLDELKETEVDPTEDAEQVPVEPEVEQEAENLEGGVEQQVPVESEPTAQQEAAPGRELAEQRTRTSRTFALPDGNHQTEIFPASIHYREDDAWVPIDNTLVASGRERYAYENEANRYTALLPDTMAGEPVRFELGDHWVEMKLKQASGSAAEVANNVALYRDVLDGVDARYKATPDALKEELILKRADASTTFIFSVEMSGGLNLDESPTGGLNVLDSSGKAILELLSPSMEDSSEDRELKSLAFDLRTADTGLEIALVADATWLADPDRVFPVIVDPTTAIKDTLKDCWIDEGGPHNDHCGGNNLRIGYNGTNRKRALVKWDTSGVPEKSKVLNARMSLYIGDTNSTDAINVQSYRITHWWSSNATWTEYNGSGLWNSAGGDFSTEYGFENQWVGGQANKAEYWLPATLVNRWVDRRTTNRGVIFKSYQNSGDNVLWVTSSRDTANEAQWPKLTIEHYPWLGEESYYKLETRQLNDKMHLHANVANGDLMVHNKDLNIRGSGMDLSVERHYNSLTPVDAGGGYEEGAFGPSWKMNSGADVRLKEYKWMENKDDGHVGYFGPSGFHVRFDRQQNSGERYQPAPGINAELTKDTSRTYPFHINFDDDKSKMKFSGDGFLKIHQDKNGNKLEFIYDHPDGDGDPNTVDVIRDTRGREITLRYDANGYIREMKDNVSTTTHPDGRTYLYDHTSGRLDTYTDPMGGIYDYNYNADGLLNEITDPKGNRTKISYDTSQRVDTITRVTASTTDTDPVVDFGYKTSATDVTDAENFTTTHDWDKIGRVKNVTDANGHSVAATYNSNARVEKYSDTGDTSTDPFSFNYSNRNLVKVNLPTGGAAESKYNDSSNGHFPTAVGDFRGKATKYRYDDSGNLTQTQYGCELNTSCNHAIHYTYGSKTQTLSDGSTISHKGLLKRIDPPPQVDSTEPGNDTKLSYNAKGELTELNPPGPHGTMTFTYDDLSRLKEMTDGKGQTTTFTYDALDRVDRIDYSNADGTSSAFIDYTYDLNGNLTERNEDSGLTTFTYDDLNRMTSKTAPSEEPMEFSYYPDGSLKTITYNPGTTNEKTITYEYNPSNLIKKMIDPDGLETVFGHNKRHLRTSVKYPNGVRVRQFWDLARRPTTIKATETATGDVLDKWSYTYESGGGKDSSLIQTEEGKSGYTKSYTYDKTSRVIEMEMTDNNGNVTQRRSYNYDKHGNITKEAAEINGTSTSFTYNKANELKSAGSRNFEYDAHGNLKRSTDDAWQASYNLKNQTTEMTSPSGTVGTMDYLDADSTERTSRGGISYTYDVLGLGSETDSDGTTTRYLRDDKGQLVQLITGGKKYFYTFDALGSVTTLSNMNATRVSSYTYHPYGKGYKGANDWSPYNPWRFASGYLDKPTGVYKFGTRYYAPQLLRWTQPDPERGQLKNPIHAQNLYAYANDNPINVTDVTGRHIFDDTLEFAECAFQVYAVFTDITGTIGFGVLAIGGALAGQPEVAIPAAAASTLSYALYMQDVERAQEECT